MSLSLVPSCRSHHPESFVHRHTGIAPPKHHPRGECLPLLPRIQSLHVRLYTHAHACIKPHTWTHGGLSSLLTAKRPMTIRTLLTPTGSFDANSVYHHHLCSWQQEAMCLQKLSFQSLWPFWAGEKWLRQRVTSVSFWAGGQRRASHVQRQRGKHLCGRGNHKLGGRLCPS